MKVKRTLYVPRITIILWLWSQRKIISVCLKKAKSYFAKSEIRLQQLQSNHTARLEGPNYKIHLQVFSLYRNDPSSHIRSNSLKRVGRASPSSKKCDFLLSSSEMVQDWSRIVCNLKTEVSKYFLPLTARLIYLYF